MYGPGCPEYSPVAQDFTSRWPALELSSFQSKRVRCGVTGTFWMSVVLEAESLSWNHSFSNKKAVLISETRWRQDACQGKLSTGTASSLLSECVLTKIEAVVIAHINIPNRFSLISRLSLGCSAPEAKGPAWTSMFGRASCLGGKSGKESGGCQGLAGQDREPTGLS